MDIESKLIEIFNDYSIDIYNEQQVSDIDSIEYISLIIEIEDSFDIEIPDEFLDGNIFFNIDMLKSLILNMINMK